MTHKTPELPKFTDALPIIPQLGPHQKGNSFTYYKVRMTECRLSLHSELHPSALWCYENSYPGPVIEVESREKTYIKWINNLPSKHFLPLDYTVHGAQILDRRPFDAEKFKKKKVISYTGPSIPPEPQERGWKDTVRANPEQVTRIIMKFGPYTGLYVWHCHILEHEDYEMMRPFIVIR